MFPNIGEEDRLARPPGEATLSAFDEWAAWQQDFFGPLFSLAASILPPALFLWILIYTSGPFLPVWATRPEEPQTYCISLNCDAKPRTLLNWPRFSTVPHVMDPDRAPFSCSSWHDWIGRAKLACKWRLCFLRHDRAIVEWLWGTAETPMTFIVLDIPDMHLNLSLLPFISSSFSCQYIFPFVHHSFHISPKPALFALRMVVS